MMICLSEAERRHSPAQRNRALRRRSL